MFHSLSDERLYDQNEAATQVQQAQGAALSVTQTALAVVGAIIGSSLLTVLGFVLILRRRRNKRRRLRLGGGSVRGPSRGGNPNIGYPELTSTSNKAYAVHSSTASSSSTTTSSIKKPEALKLGPGPGRAYAASDDGSSTYSTDEDEKALAAAAMAPSAAALALARSNTNITRKSVGVGAGAGVGYAVSYYGPRSQPTVNVNGDAGGGPPPAFQLRDPPPPRGAKFSLFPRSRDEFAAQSASASASAASPAGREEEQPTGQTQRASRSSFPSLDAWLRSGTNVSPFSTLKGAQTQAR